MPRPPRTNVALLIIFFTMLVLAGATWITVGPINVSMVRQYHVDLNASPLGYTRSLSLILIPFALLLYWYFKYSQAHRPHLRCFGLTALIVAVTWALLDVLFAPTIFYFPNCAANLQLYLPGFIPGSGFERVIPVEEFVFYLFSILLLLLIYMWASEVWFSSGTIDPADHVQEGLQAIPVVFGINHWSLIAAVALILGGMLIQSQLGHVPLAAPSIPLQCNLPPPHGFTSGKIFPVYFTLLVLLLFVPSAFLFNRVKRFVNTGAIHFTILLAVLISLIWEATLALPYGWWGYQPDYMLGIYVGPWFDLPIESVILWVASGWSSVFLYEFVRLRCVTGQNLLVVAFGDRDGRKPPGPESSRPGPEVPGDAEGAKQP